MTTKYFYDPEPDLLLDVVENDLQHRRLTVQRSIGAGAANIVVKRGDMQQGAVIAGLNLTQPDALRVAAELIELAAPGEYASTTKYFLSHADRIEAEEAKPVFKPGTIVRRPDSGVRWHFINGEWLTPEGVKLQQPPETWEHGYDLVYEPAD